jgi:hypothetical protein
VSSSDEDPLVKIGEDNIHLLNEEKAYVQEKGDSSNLLSSKRFDELPICE